MKNKYLKNVINEIAAEMVTENPFTRGYMMSENDLNHRLNEKYGIDMIQLEEILEDFVKFSQMAAYKTCKRCLLPIIGPEKDGRCSVCNNAKTQLDEIEKIAHLKRWICSRAHNQEEIDLVTNYLDIFNTCFEE